jgi:nucleotide-binding universal stress UspA family protein
MINATRILVPLNGTPTDADAMNLACEVAKRNKAEVYAIYVIEVKRTLPLDVDLPPEAERAEQILADAARVAKPWSITPQSEILQARDIGTAIVDEAIERGVDLIVLGIRYKRRFGDFDMGHTAPHVLRHAPCRVWVVRAPAEIPPQRTVQHVEPHPD